MRLALRIELEGERNSGSKLHAAVVVGGEEIGVGIHLRSVKRKLRSSYPLWSAVL